jgi:hypothetical protein
MTMKAIQLVTIFLFLNAVFLCSCSENLEESKKNDERNKATIIKTFSDKPQIFTDLFFYFKFNHIAGISFVNDSLVRISFTSGDFSKKTEVEEITAPENSEKIIRILQMDGFNYLDLKKLKFGLSEINCTNITFIANHDVTRGRDTKELLLTLPKFNNSLPVYYYRVYQQPLDSAAVNPNFLINNKKTGGKLSDHVIWYFKWKL